MTAAQRRVGPVLVGAILAVLLVVPAVPADAAWLQAHGWWWRAQTGLQGIVLPGPGDVPEDGLLVEQSLLGTMAISAVRIDLEGGVDPVLTLEVAVVGAATPDSVIIACPARSFWLPASAGTWDQRPDVDCDAGVDGTPDETGERWTWELADVVDDGFIDVVLVPAGSAPLRVAFEAPDDDAVSTQPGAPEPDSTSVDHSQPPPPPPHAQAPPAAGPPVSLPPPSPPSASVPPADDEIAPPAVAPRATPPQAAGSPTVAPDAAGVAQPAAVGADPVVRRVGWVLLVAMLALVVLSWGGWPWVVPAVAMGGFGRFQRQRSGHPPPLR